MVTNYALNLTARSLFGLFVLLVIFLNCSTWNIYENPRRFDIFVESTLLFACFLSFDCSAWNNVGRK